MEIEAIDGFLRQAACPDEMRERVGRLVESGHADEGLPALARHRAELLGQIHEADHRLFCLDRVIAEITDATGA